MKKKKGYFSISAVSHMLNIHQQTIRTYEKLGLISPKRSGGNTRMFSDQDIETLETIMYFTNKLGVNLSGVEIILKMQKKIDKMQNKMNTIFSQSKQEFSKEVSILEQDIAETKKEIKKLHKRIIKKNKNKEKELQSSVVYIDSKGKKDE